MSVKKSATLFNYAITIYVPATNMPLKCHIYATHTNYFIYRYENWYTHISYYWHLPLNKNFCHIAHVCPTALLINLHTDSLVLHISIKDQYTATFINQITAKYVQATNMPIQSHKYTLFQKILTVHLWGKDTNIYAKFEAGPINDAARFTVQKCC